MDEINVVEVILLFIILILVIALILGAIYAYNWVMYYINIGEEYINNFDAYKVEIKDSLNMINTKLDNIESKIRRFN